MSIPMKSVSIKFPPDEIPKLHFQADYRGADGVGEYIRQLVLQDRKAMREQHDVLSQIFDSDEKDGKNYPV